MKQSIQKFGYVVLLSGIALIFLGFFLLVPEQKRNSIFWLDLITTCFVFVTFSITQLGLLGVNINFEKQVGSLGIRLVYIRLYSFIAIAIMLIGYFADLNFRYQFFFQLVAAFILLIGYFFSKLSSRNVHSVQSEQDNNRKSKDEIIKALNQFEILFAGDSAKWLGEKQKISLLKENARYLSPTNNQSATDLDIEITTIIQKAYSLAKEKNEGGKEVFSLLNRCEELLVLRKNTYSN